MKYIAVFYTNAGTIRAEWKGREYVHLYPNGSDSATSAINVWDYPNDKPLIAESAESMAAYVREYLWEMERGLSIERIVVSQEQELSDFNEDGEF